ncbi:hypothetical protein [Bradyrhizobium sp.]|uniref:hypothetical protein n=1 Tax=Bradyrhizobium sp. TaxID=376 RepID=UPI002DDC988D|nr:hypothetical protein [Bradyrhizobium sp.]HEV2154029.1 hypothetical protein [Bradyrhizobium sp.]
MTSKNQRNIVICLIALGMACFLGQGLIASSAPDFLNEIELPNSLGSMRLAAPDGRVFIVSEPLGRVQRYGPSGFERGFQVHAGGGTFDAGISPSGEVLLCLGRSHELVRLDQDGRETGPRQSCARNVWGDDRIPFLNHYAARVQVPLIAFSWIAAMAVPLWHPFTAWLLMMVGILLSYYFRFREAKADSAKHDGIGERKVT